MILRLLMSLAILSMVFIFERPTLDLSSLSVDTSTQTASAKPKKKKKDRYLRKKKASKARLSEGHPSVDLTIKTDPRVKARVYHGKELLGVTPLSLKWAKDTGPLDIVVKAGGYLHVNSRIYTYRDDRVTIKMFKKDQAHLLFGYKKKVKKELDLEAEGAGAGTE